MEAMGGYSILSVPLEALTERMQSADLITYAREGNVWSELHKWRIDLMALAAVVDNAEEKGSTNRLVKNWVIDLKDLVYDVEDVVDELQTEAHLRRLNKSKSPPGLIVTGLKTKIDNITAELGDIMRRKQDLGLTVERKTSQLTDRPPTTSLVNEAKIYGREKDLNAIRDLLKPNEEVDDGGISVLAIVGMGGIGKTTLARLIFNDDKLQFDFKSWVCDGGDFDIRRMTKTILQGDGKDLNSLQVMLKEKLSGKKFLIVLDDVWTKDYDLWTLFTCPFSSGARGSRILITTRDREVSSKFCSVPNGGFSLDKLSTDDCKSVFATHALGAKDFNAHADLEKIGEEIVKRCQGLPLAAKAIGGLLRGTPNLKSWERVLNSQIWKETSDILPALKLSYHHLPSHLKQCFAYCAVFPKDYEFEKNELIFLWMGEGIFHQRDDGDTYFDDLVSRSFFQQLGDQKSLYVMHDLMNELARSISGEVCFNLDEEMETKKSSLKVRHSAFKSRFYETARRFECFHQMKNSLRTFLAWSTLEGELEIYNYLSSQVLDDLIPQFERLRVLCLSRYNIVDLPHSIGGLKHLRYLNVSHTPIQRLPDSICKLINLQILLLRECGRLLELPTKLADLTNLQCLDISGTHCLKEMPLNIGNLKKLHTLTRFIVGSGEGHGIAELIRITNLQGKLHISGLQNVKNVHEMRSIKIKEMKGLDELVLQWEDEFGDSVLQWEDEFGDSREESKELSILELLQPQENITSLLIRTFGGTKFPLWFGNSLLDNLTFLVLSNCPKITLLPPLGRLPSLRDLSINGMVGVKKVGMEFHGGGFPSLESLNIRNMREWEEWLRPTGSASEHMLCELRELTIRNCPKLVGSLAVHLSSLQRLQIDECPLLGSLAKGIPPLGELEDRDRSDLSFQRLNNVWDPLFKFSNRRSNHLGELEVRNCNEVIFKSMPENLASLKKLKLYNISGLWCLNEAFFIQPFVELSISDCKELRYLWGEGIDIGKLASLKKLEIEYCEELVSLVEGEEGNFPCNLQSLTITMCVKLEQLPNKLHRLTSLTELNVYGWNKLENFPISGLPHSLKSLSIRDCASLSLRYATKGILMEVSDGNDNNDDDNNNNNEEEKMHIEGLSIRYINKSLAGAPSDVGKYCLSELFPNSLTSLGFSGDTFIPILFESLQRQNWLSRLTCLWILECKELEWFPTFPGETGLPIPTLSAFILENCTNLRSLPDYMYKLTSLKNLSIKNSPHLVSFPQGGFPTSLSSLKIVDCSMLERLPLSEWRLHTLANLQYLIIEGDMELVTSFSDDNGGFQLLPPTLTFLSVNGFKNLEFISIRLEMRSSLEYLSIYNCPKLQSLDLYFMSNGLLGSLSSLQKLYIWSCPQIHSLPNGFPPSLESLYIENSPSLKCKCRKGEGEYWPLIAPIPYIHIVD